MGKECDAKYYDQIYRTSWRYKKGIDDAPWARLWHWIAGRAGRQMIIDFGCGPGHLAGLLRRQGHPSHLYLGVDFSKEALNQARKRAPGYRFICDVLPAAVSLVRNYEDPTVIFCEVLEHFKADRPAIKQLPEGTRVLATVPQKDSTTHVRHFTKMSMVPKRYEGFLDITSIERIGGAYAFEGRRRARKKP